MRRQRVEDLVGDDEPDDRRAVVGLEPIGDTGGREPIAQLVEPPRLDLDRPVADDGGEVGRHRPPGPTRIAAASAPLARAELPDREAVRPPERSPHVLDVAGERPTEDRVGLRRGQEVAAASGPGRRRPVVAGTGS